LNCRVIFREAARDEAVEAALYIAGRGSAESAARWYEGLVEALDSLRRMPERCGFARENDCFSVELRQLVYKSHRIIFTVREKTVHVLHGRHAAIDELEQL